MCKEKEVKPDTCDDCYREKALMNAHKAILQHTDFDLLEKKDRKDVVYHTQCCIETYSNHYRNCKCKK